MRGLLALLVPLLAVCAYASGDAPRLPSADASNGRTLAGPARVFSGSGLYGHIDGGAEIFFEFGFDELTVQRYVLRDGFVDVELYRMADPVAALGIYLSRCGNRCDAPRTLTGYPAYTTRGTTQLVFVQDRFLAVITAENASGQCGGALPALASELTKRLPPDRPADPGASLPVGWLPGSLRLIRGPLALQAIVTLGEGDVLQLGGQLTAVAADYAAADSRPAHTLLIVDHADETTAKAALAHLRQSLDPEIKVLRESRGSFVFRDYAGKFGSAATAGRRLMLRLNLASDPGQ